MRLFSDSGSAAVSAQAVIRYFLKNGMSEKRLFALIKLLKLPKIIEKYLRLFIDIGEFSN